MVEALKAHLAWKSVFIRKDAFETKTTSATRVLPSIMPDFEGIAKKLVDPQESTSARLQVHCKND
jgi:hypothetical protein